MSPKLVGRVAALVSVVCSLTLLPAALDPPAGGPQPGTANARATINING